MQWYSGDIGSAINLAKTNNAIFVVYCEGKDENSKTLTNYINTEAISSRLQTSAFVCIKILSDQPEYIQFSKIYQLVPIPSIFFIKNGIPIKIVTSAAKSLEEIIEAIDGLNNQPVSSNTEIQKAEEKEPSVKQSTSSEDKASKKEPEIVCEDGVCYKKEPNQSTSKSEDVPSEAVSVATSEKVETEEEKQEKIKRAMKLIEEKRIERIKEEQRLEKEREIRRRVEGREMQRLKNWQDEQELQQLKDERRKEKLEAMEARRRVLEQIEEDKKERARKFNIPQQQQPETEAPKQDMACAFRPKRSKTTDSAKIQFKKPDGEAEIVTFDIDMLFGDLHSFVKSDLLQGSNIKEFTLATTFPRREFTSEDFEKTLQDLNLAPSSVLLIIPGKKSAGNLTQNRGGNILPTNTDGSFFDMISALIMGLVSPIFAVFAYIKNFVFRSGTAENNGNGSGRKKRDEESLMPNDAAKKRNMNAYNQPEEPSTSSGGETGTIPKPSTYKRMNPSSNIHRLHQDSDSEDERKTYNGNSTQQM